MCFVNEGDWTAAETYDSILLVDREMSCDECYAKIKPGDVAFWSWACEHETCQTCEQDEDRWENDEYQGCNCGKPDFGETCDYHRCWNCHLFLEAIEAAEIDAGCPKYASRPMLFSLREELVEGGAREAKKYYRKAIVMFPQLKEYLAFTWRRCFG